MTFWGFYFLFGKSCHPSAMAFSRGFRPLIGLGSFSQTPNFSFSKFAAGSSARSLTGPVLPESEQDFEGLGWHGARRSRLG